MSQGWSLPRAYAPPGESPDTITRSNQAGLITGASTNVRKHISVFHSKPTQPRDRSPGAYALSHSLPTPWCARPPPTPPGGQRNIYIMPRPPPRGLARYGRSGRWHGASGGRGREPPPRRQNLIYHIIKSECHHCHIRSVEISQ